MQQQFPRPCATALLVVSLIASLTGCGSDQSGPIARYELLAETCPLDAAKVATRISSDESGTSRGQTAQSARQDVIRRVAERNVICGGRLRVDVFSGSMLSTTVFDRTLQLDGATQNARLRRAPGVVQSVMDEINASLPHALRRLTDGATDIVGQYQNGSEFGRQLREAGSYTVEQIILTDGIQTVGVDLEDESLTEQQATDMASTVTVPDLTGASVRLIGIGRQANDAPLPTPYIAALRAFHTAVCEKTGATCTVVTDAAAA